MTIIELREKRNKAWDAAKAFVETRRNKDGLLSDEDAKTYAEMEQKVKDYSTEIDRMERQEAIDRQMSAPTSTPITAKPEAAVKPPVKAGRATDTYKDAFWNQVRNNKPSYEIRNALQVGVDTEGGYLCPDEFEHQLISGLVQKNVIRGLSTVFTTSSGVHKIPVASNRGTAAWVDEEGPIPEGSDTFGQQMIGAHKLATLIKVSEELLSDSAFDLEKYFITEFARRIGTREEEAFLTGDGTGKPSGVLNDAEVGITTASATAITADELVDLYYSLDAPYRANAVWVLNDATMKNIRKLKDTTGQYLWQPALHEGGFETLLGKRIFTSPQAPILKAGEKPIAFGDFSYYWIGDRQGITFRRLNERYADTGQVGFLASKRVDAKLILPEAIKVLQMKSAT